ncbi:hypothetical protein L218DRAFT_960213 [Marasmius fiardii PR-910]|nr:hypothetical protein L218DRAFT_960213 [Marasmius fiardii PR-910]
MSAPQALPNPLTPLAFLPPDIANQFEVSRYLYAVTLGGYIWDCAINLGNDYKLLFQHSIRYPTIIYYLSRISTMGYIVSSFVFQVGNVSDCQKLQVALGIFYVLTTAFTSLLFLLRVIAVWNRNKWIVATFTFFWLGTVGATVTVPVGISGGHIGPTKACINTRVEGYAEATAIASMINDSAVFFAITYRILMNSLMEERPSVRLQTFIGKGSSFLPTLSRNLLRSGQHYYLVALSGNIVALVMLKIPNLPVFYHAMCTLPVLAVINSMACIVYRQIKFGLITVEGTRDFQSFGSFRAAPMPSKQGATNSSLPMHARRQDSSNGASVTLHGSNGHLKFPSKVQVNITEDHALHYDKSSRDDHGAV